MASFSCGITGELCEEPTATPSGSVYERKHIERYIQENGCDPETKRALSKDELIVIKQSPKVTPAEPNAMSISSIIKSLRDEYDATVLYNAKMQKDVRSNNGELTDQLYTHDAATRVIRALTEQMIQVRVELEKARQEDAERVAEERKEMKDEQMEDEEEKGMTEAIMERLQSNAKRLTGERKGRSRKPPPELASQSDLAEYAVKHNYPALHSASVPGITCLDVHDNIMVTGGNDRSVVIFNSAEQEIIATCKGHQKAIASVVHHPTRQSVISTSIDSTVRIWNYENEENVTQTKMKFHQDHVTDLSLHPISDYMLTTSKDKSWLFSDINTGTELIRTFDDDQVTSGQFHPDGLIFATGTSRAEVKIWDLKSSSQGNAKPAAQPLRGHLGPVEAIAFSENGFHLATASRGNEVKLWDLRKLKNVKTLTMSDSFKVRHLQFDKSGQYLSVAGNDVRIFRIKEWNEVVRLSAHTDDVTCSRWGHMASKITTCSMDRTVKVFSL